jgi:hypothetical protein
VANLHSLRIVPGSITPAGTGVDILNNYSAMDAVSLQSQPCTALRATGGKIPVPG